VAPLCRGREDNDDHCGSDCSGDSSTAVATMMSAAGAVGGGRLLVVVDVDGADSDS